MKCECKSLTHLNRRVTVQRPTEDAGDDGHTDLKDDANWENVGVLWGAFKTRGGREAQVFDQVEATVSHLIDFRYGTTSRSIIPKWRLKMGTRIFNVVSSVDVDEAHKTIQVSATEAV